MADIAKNVPAVSNPSSPVCELTSDSPELTFPSQDDGSSLQELIESELALRISSVSSSPDDEEAEDENTKFLLAERTHSFQNYTGNDTFFFSTLEEEELPTRLTLGNFDPFTTTIDTESSPSVECDNGMPVTPLTNHSPLLIPEIDIIPPDDLEQDDEDGWTTVGEAVAPENFVEQNQDIVGIQLGVGVEETQNIIEQENQKECVIEEEEEKDQFMQGDYKVECNVDVDNFNLSNGSSFEQETHDSSFEGDTVLKQSHEIEGISESDYNEDSGSLITFEKDSLIQVQTNGMQAQDSITEDMFEGEQELESPNERKEYVGHNGIPLETLENGDGELEYSGHHNGTVDSEHDMCSSLSDSDRGENIAEKRTKKTKSETTVKKSKKTKKSEKENISVISNGTHSPNLTAEQEREKEDDDDLSNVSVRALKQTYCNEANRSFEKKEFYDGKERIETGVSIKELRRSFGDLTSACDDEPERNSGATSLEDVKSSFSKFDQLTKKSVLHVRSVDASKVQKQFNQNGVTAGTEQTSNCKSCEKQVFQMEQIKAERAVWHKNCFRCKECSKQLTVDTYSSHEGQLYCKPHFRELFKPKAVIEDEKELPSDKPDLGLEELSSLDMKSRFHVFEKTADNENEVERSPSSVSVKRSPSILSKLAKFQKKGMDVGVTDESLNGIPYEESSSSSEEEDDEDGEQNGEVNRDVIRSNRKQRERPVSFSKMEDIKCRWETGQAARKEELREERKHEISNIRSRLFMGHQGKMKEMYEQAVQESEKSAQKKNLDIKSEKARSIKEKFERGEVVPDDEEDGTVEDKNKKLKDEDLGVFEAGISKKSRSIFLELDATAVKTQQQAPTSTPIKSPNPTYEARRENSPEREVYRNPDVVRSDDRIPDEEIVRSHTTSKMLSLFRQLEENASKDDVPEGPKPLKRFTPPPDYTHESNTSEEESDSEEEDEEEEEEDYESNPNLVKSSDKIEDEFLKQAQSAARAKALRAKFERWEEKENKANMTNSSGHFNGVDLEINEQASIDTTKSLRARFESLTSETQKPKETISRPKVNRFVEIQTNQAEYCDTCEKKVYPLEKIETGGKIFHKQCFRCLQCNCILRMETYTLNGGKPYCIPHFKQLFIAKGNYDEGFGLDQHKRKWNVSHEDEVFQNGNDNIESS